MLVASNPERLAADVRWADIAEAYLAEVRLRSDSKASEHNYRLRIREFLRAVPDPLTATAGQIQLWAYSATQRAATASATVVLQRLAAVAGLYRFAMRLEFIDRNPADRVPRPKKPTATHRALTDGELQKLLAACKPNHAGRRLECWIRLCIYTASRKDELMQLRGGNINQREDGAWLYRVRIKGGSIRTRALPPPAVEAIAGYLWYRGKRLDTLGASEPVFDSSYNALWSNLKRTAERAGIEAVTSHGMRHSAALCRYKRGATAAAIQNLLSHKHSSSTARYLQHVVGDDDEEPDGWGAAVEALGG